MMFCIPTLQENRALPVILHIFNKILNLFPLFFHGRYFSVPSMNTKSILSKNYVKFPYFFKITLSLFWILFIQKIINIRIISYKIFYSINSWFKDYIFKYLIYFIFTFFIFLTNSSNILCSFSFFPNPFTINTFINFIYLLEIDLCLEKHT